VAAMIARSPVAQFRMPTRGADERGRRLVMTWGDIFGGLPRPVSDSPGSDESILEEAEGIVWGECVKGV
jgi:hypothetical protein